MLFVCDDRSGIFVSGTPSEYYVSKGSGSLLCLTHLARRVALKGAASTAPDAAKSVKRTANMIWVCSL